MNHLTLRLAMRLAVPVLALGALAVTGQPIHSAAQRVSSAEVAAIACEPAPPEAARHAGEESERRQRVALRLRWSLTLPAAPRLLGVHVAVP